MHMCNCFHISTSYWMLLMSEENIQFFSPLNLTLGTKGYKSITSESPNNPPQSKISMKIINRCGVYLFILNMNESTFNVKSLKNVHLYEHKQVKACPTIYAVWTQASCLNPMHTNDHTANRNRMFLSLCVAPCWIVIGWEKNANICVFRTPTWLRDTFCPVLAQPWKLEVWEV